MPCSGQDSVFESSPVLETDNWGVAYGDKVVLAGLNLRIAPNAITALMGAAGAGKSTLLRSLAGVNNDNTRFREWGRVHYASQPLSATHRPGMVRQHARLMLATVQQSLLEFTGPSRPLAIAAQRDWCADYLERMGFTELADKLSSPAVELPAAQQRAIAILREAVANPALLMVDEPTADLSDYDSYPLLGLLRRLAQERAVLLVTHNQRHARNAAQHLLLLAGGCIHESSSIEEFFAAPQSIAGQQFLHSGSCAVSAPQVTVEAAIAAAQSGVAAPGESALVASHAHHDRQREKRAVLPDLVLATPILPAAQFVAHARGPRGFAWLVPGRLAGTPLPGVVHDADVDLSALRRCGVTVLISLTERDIDQAPLARHGLRNVHLPVYDREPPTVAQLQMLMLKMKRLLLNGEVLAVHCLAGLGRTGTVLAAWLVFEGVTAEEALRRVRSVESQYVQSETQEAVLYAYEDMLLEKMG